MRTSRQPKTPISNDRFSRNEKTAAMAAVFFVSNPLILMIRGSSYRRRPVSIVFKSLRRNAASQRRHRARRRAGAETGTGSTLNACSMVSKSLSRLTPIFASTAIPHMTDVK